MNIKIINTPPSAFVSDTCCSWVLDEEVKIGSFNDGSGEQAVFRYMQELSVPSGGFGFDHNLAIDRYLAHHVYFIRLAVPRTEEPAGEQLGATVPPEFVVGSFLTNSIEIEQDTGVDVPVRVILVYTKTP